LSSWAGNLEPCDENKKKILEGKGLGVMYDAILSRLRVARSFALAFVKEEDVATA
jgi:hypothetical protein